MAPNIVDGLNDCSLQFVFCECYIYRKENNVQLYSSFHKSVGLLDLIHFDVFGRIKVPSISKVLYDVSLVDNYSRRTWVYFLRMKYEVFSWFKSLNLSCEIILVGRLMIVSFIL
jgi:hypothetical protein